MPAPRRCSAPPATDGLGSTWPKTTRATPAPTRVSAQRPARSLPMHGSRVTTAVAPRAAAARGCGQGGDLGVRGTSTSVEPLGEDRPVRPQQDTADVGGWGSVPRPRRAQGRWRDASPPSLPGWPPVTPLRIGRGSSGWRRLHRKQGHAHRRRASRRGRARASPPIRTLTVGPGVPPGQPADGFGRVADCHRRFGIAPTPGRTSCCCTPPVCHGPLGSGEWLQFPCPDDRSVHHGTGSGLLGGTPRSRPARGP